MKKLESMHYIELYAALHQLPHTSKQARYQLRALDELKRRLAPPGIIERDRFMTPDISKRQARLLRVYHELRRLESITN